MFNYTDCTVLVVDDVEINLELLTETLDDFCQVLTAQNGKSAISVAKEKAPDLILLDIMMPGMNGFEVCKELKASKTTSSIPVIFVTAKGEEEDESGGFEVGAVDYIRKPIKPSIVSARVKNHLQLKRTKEELEAQKDSLEAKVEERTKQITKIQEAAIRGMATLAEYRDPETGGHIKRTLNYMKLLAETLRENPKFEGKIDDKWIDLLTRTAPLHDIGKVGVPDNILLKPGKLTKDEFKEIKKHPKYGRDALRASAEQSGEELFFNIGMEIAYTHHEKWDGTGYPRGLKGEDIPLAGRLMALSDVYDALISKRVYKSPFTHTKAANIIKEGRGSHFDPAIVDAFIEISEKFREIALKHADFEEERETLKQ